MGLISYQTENIGEGVGVIKGDHTEVLDLKSIVNKK